MDGPNVIYSSGANYRFLKPGIYVYSKYTYANGAVCTTLDVRFKRPHDPWENNATMSTKVVHTIQHLGSEFLRSHPAWSDKVILFSPMGSKTGFYLVLAGDYHVAKGSDIHRLIMDMCRFIVNYEGNIPNAAPVHCGDCVAHNLGSAKRQTALYLKALTKSPCFEYPVSESAGNTRLAST